MVHLETSEGVQIPFEAKSDVKSGGLLSSVPFCTAALHRTVHLNEECTLFPRCHVAAFSLSQDWELPARREEEKQPLKEGVQDMLVKHHLFSWDIDG